MLASYLLSISADSDTRSTRNVADRKFVLLPCIFNLEFVSYNPTFVGNEEIVCFRRIVENLDNSLPGVGAVKRRFEGQFDGCRFRQTAQYRGAEPCAFARSAHLDLSRTSANSAGRIVFSHQPPIFQTGCGDRFPDGIEHTHFNASVYQIESCFRYAVKRIGTRCGPEIGCGIARCSGITGCIIE